MGYTSEIRKKVGSTPIFTPIAACGLVQDGRILLQKRADDGHWGLHGGCLELGETFQEAMVRELKEELNITVVESEIVGVYSGEKMHAIYPNGDEVYMISVAYLVTGFFGELAPDQKEVSQLRWFEIDNLPRQLHEIDAPIIWDIIRLYRENTGSSQNR